LQADDPLRRAGAALYFAGWRGWTPADLARTAGIADGEPLAGQLAAAGELVEFAISPTRTARIHRDVLDEVALRIEAALAKLHAQQPLAAAFERAQLTSRFARLAREAQAGEALLTTVLRRMAAAGRISASERGVALAGRGPKLSPQQADLLDKIIEVYRQAAFQPPSAEQVQSQFVKNLADVPRLIKLAVAEGRLVAISPEFCLHAEAERQMRETLDTKLAGGAGLTVSQIRELLGTTRKYAVPICEYLDRIGFTQRRGDLRVRA
jgi:selenocysteine-specific elongation factor